MMKLLRLVCGIVALVALVAGLNLLALKQNLFLASVLVPFGVSLAAGIVWLGLALAAKTRDSFRQGQTLYGISTTLSTLVFLGICIVLYAFAQHGDPSWDLTKEGRRKLSDQTVQVLESLSKDVDIICFFLQIDDELVRIAAEKTERFLDQCAQHTSHLKIEYLDPQIERARLEGLNITHASTQGTIVIRCGNRQKVITLQGGSPRLEERDFTNSLINVIRDATPKVYFLTGHGERSVIDPDKDKGGTLFKSLLEGEAYQVDRCAIMISKPEVPADCDVLVIDGLGVAGPQSDLHPEEIRAIQAFMDRGGRLLILLDPWQKVIAGQNQVEQLLPWLEQRYGVIVGNDMAISPTSKWTVEFTADTSLFDDGKQSQPAFMGSFSAEHGITARFDQKILFSAARTVRLADTMPPKTAGTELLRTTPDFYAETDLATLAGQGKASRGPGETNGPLSMAVAVTAKTSALIGDTGQTRDARLVVVGDSDFASNGQIASIPGNFNFILNTMAWLTENEDLIAIRPTGKQAPPVILSDYDQRAIVWIAVLGTVQAVAVAGMIAFVLRRKYQ